MEQAIFQDNVTTLRDVILSTTTNTNICNEPIQIRGLSLSPLSVAVVANAKRCFHELLYEQPTVDITASLAVFECLRYYRTDMLYMICNHPKWNPNHQIIDTGDTALHAVCKFQRPNISFLKYMCGRKDVKVNIQNADGLTPLCLVALNSVGVDGREAAMVLLRRGAKRTEALQRTTNLHIRQAVCLNGSLNRRTPTLPADIEEELDAVEDLNKLPDISHRIVADVGNNSSGSMKAAKSPSPSPSQLANSTVKKLSKEEMDRSATALSQIVGPKSVSQFWENKNKKKEEQRVLSLAEVEEINERLFRSSRETTLEHMNKQYEKYQPPIPEPKKLSVDEIKESCERLSVV
eukprot:PhF_6_TR14889/c0_g2_i3/m.23217